MLVPLGEPGVPVPDPIPAAVRQGSKVYLADHDYLLYAGPVEAVAAMAPMPDMDQTPCLWWPDDRAWCVASTIDLPWTYVGGPAGLIERILEPAEPGGLTAAQPGHARSW
jgi:hypothetical protein